MRRSVIDDPAIEETKRLISDLKLNTVCRDSRCPNIYECFSEKKCTFLILGRRCTRSCKFCSIETGEGTLEPPDKDEPLRILEAVKALGLDRVVITSVSRDDLEDGGAASFSDCINILRKYDAALNIEVLVPDFGGRPDLIASVVSAGPDVFSHNVETVPRLYAEVRPQADYKRSLAVIRRAKELGPEMDVKSGLMVGLGETEDEVRGVMEDLSLSGCDIVTIGQYLNPGAGCLEVREFVSPGRFWKFSEWAGELGFKGYSCSPFTRSSYV